MPGDIKNGNPRYHNGNFRRKMRQRFRSMDAPCGICKGRLGAIHYDEPSNAQHPLSFVIDEIKPISRYREWGYESREQACMDVDNLQASHWVCNQRKSNKSMVELCESPKKLLNVSDGQW